MKSLKRTGLACLLTACSAFAACGGMPLAPDESAFYLEVHRGVLDCESPNDRSPETYLRDDFIGGVVNGRSHRVTNIICVEENFTKRDISSYADSGDPVAQLFQLASKFRLKKDACNNAGELISGLRNIAESKAQEELSEKDIVFRVPESYYLISLVLDDCGMQGGEAAMMRSYQYGFDPSVVVNSID